MGLEKRGHSHTTKSGNHSCLSNFGRGQVMTAQHVYDFLIAQFDCIHGGHSQSLVQIEVQNLVCHQHQLSLPLQSSPTHLFSVLFLFLDLRHFKQYPLQLWFWQNLRILCPSTVKSVTSENYSAHGLSSLSILRSSKFCSTSAV
jgi:hypothetical protein